MLQIVNHCFQYPRLLWFCWC